VAAAEGAGPAARSSATEASTETDRRDQDLQKLARGSSLNLAGSLVAAVLSFVLPIIIARGLAKDDAGAFFAATALFTILVNVGVVGADTGLLRSLPRARALDGHQDLRTLLRVAVLPPALLAVAMAAALWLLAPHIADVGSRTGSDTDTYASFLQVLAPGVPFAVVYLVLIAASRGLGPVKPLVLVEKIGRNAVQTGLVWVVQVLAPSATLLALAWVAPYGAALLVIAVWVRRLLRAALGRAPADGTRRPTGEIRREFWSFSAPRALSRVFSVALQRLDILLVASLRGLEDAAVYTVASRFLVVGLMFVQAIQQVMAPKISELLAREETERATTIYRTTTAWLTAVSWPMYLMAAVFAEVLLSIFGPGYARGEPVVVILCLTMLVATSCGPVDTVLLMGGRSTLSLVNTGLALALNVGLNLWLIPPYGITGAALAWMAAILVNNLLPLAEVQRFLRMHPFGQGTVRAGGIALITFGALPLLVRETVGDDVVGLVVAGVLGTAAFSALAWTQRGVLDLPALGAVLRRRNGRPGQRLI
jgi:O-antigen/teichoic acid export membrane protein